MTSPEKETPIGLWPVVGVLSGLVLVFLFWLIYFKPVEETRHAWVGYLPQLNASLNFTSLCLVCGGLFAIRQRKVFLHRLLMLSALGASALFLVSYVIYHHFHGHTPYPLPGGMRTLYRVILVSHILLSVVLVPLLLATFGLAFMGRYESHRRLARFTWPIWVYVSLTGVAVFLMLRAALG